MKANTVLSALIVLTFGALFLRSDKVISLAKSEREYKKTVWFNADFRWGGFKRYVA